MTRRQSSYVNDLAVSGRMWSVPHLGQNGKAHPDGWKPPEIRSDLLKLHQLAMGVVNKGQTDQARELFELANDLEDQFFDMAESLESIQETLYKLTALYPESLLYDDDDEQEVQAP